MVRVDNLLKSQAFKLKGRLYTFTVLQLLSNSRELFAQQLEEFIAKAPRFFDKTPIVLDCSALLDSQLDLQSFCQTLRLHKLMPVAVQGTNSNLEILAQEQGLAILNSSSAHDKPIVDESPEEQPTLLDQVKFKLQTTPVRSGQQLVRKGGDLVVASSVGHGAELLADGNIHVYGALRGRALAGISGDRQARIFCLSLEAELVSIAGFYRLSDAIEPHAGPCQIYLQDEHILIEPLC